MNIKNGELVGKNNFHILKDAVIKRLPVVIMSVGIIGLGLGSRYGLSGFWAKYLGVALWATMVYSFVLFLKPSFSVLSASGVSLFISWTVEFAQLTWLPAFLSAKHILLRLIFGSHFSVYDLPAYLVGIILGALLHIILRRTIYKPDDLK